MAEHRLLRWARKYVQDPKPLTRKRAGEVLTQFIQLLDELAAGDRQLVGTQELVPTKRYLVKLRPGAKTRRITPETFAKEVQCLLHYADRYSK